MGRHFVDVAYSHLAAAIKALAEPRGRMHITDIRETLKQRLQGAFDLLMAQLAEWEPAEDQRNSVYGKLMSLAESVERFLGVSERQTLEHHAARIKGRQLTPGSISG